MSKNIGQLQDKNGNSLFPIGVEIINNSNGKAIKFPDGTMICTLKISQTIDISQSWNGFYYSHILTLPFVINFVELYSCTRDVFCGGRNVWIMSGGFPNINGTGNFYILCPESATGIGVEIHITAIGRWK